MQSELERIQRMVESAGQRRSTRPDPWPAGSIDASTRGNHPLRRGASDTDARPCGPAAPVIRPLCGQSVCHARAIEQTITRRIQTLLEGLKLPAPFKDERLGDDQIHARFPLVQRLEDK